MAMIDKASQEVYLLALSEQVVAMRARIERMRIQRGGPVSRHDDKGIQIACLEAQVDALELVAFSIEHDQPSWIANSFALSGHGELDPLARMRHTKGTPRKGVIQ